MSTYVIPDGPPIVYETAGASTARLAVELGGVHVSSTAVTPHGAGGGGR